MATSWNNFASMTFHKYIQNVYTFDDFNTKLRLINNDNHGKKLKGNLMEYFAKLYFELLPINKKLYKEFYLYTEIPKEKMGITELPPKDKGIDGLLIDYDDNMYSVQIKFRSDQKIIPWGELSSFVGLTFGTYVKNLSGGVLFTNCFDVCKELEGEKYNNITYYCFDKCDDAFWDNARKYVQKRKRQQYVVMNPLPHQEKILPIIKDYYEKYTNGRLYLPCGTGKTFIGYWATIKILECDTVFIVVPSLYLLSESYEAWSNEIQYLKPTFKFTLIGSDINNKNECEYKPTTDLETIKNNLENYDKHVVITTYHSSNLLLEACKDLNYKFDFGIFDEAHRTTGESDKKFTCLISDNYNIAKNRMFMTATEKIYNYVKNKISNNDETEHIFSMDNEKVYGKIICKYSTRQAINDSQLVDYKIVAPFMSTNVYDTLIEKNNIIKTLSNRKNNKGEKKYEMKLILLCAIVKQAMINCKFTHLLIFSNKNSKARKIYEILLELFDDDDNIYLQCLSGKDNMTTRRSEVKDFEKAERGIISSARIFGEGVNIKACDAVCFADNKSSTSDIVQYAGRCLRKYHLSPNKIGYVIIPFLLDDNNNDNDEEDNFFTNENNSYIKLRRILKTLGDTDDMITENFSLMDCGKDVSVRTNDKADYHPYVIVANTTINLNTFAQHILSKIFDRTGDRELRIRTIVINENKKRWNENNNLIDTKKKCIQFWKDSGIDDKYPTTKNWVKFCLGNDLFQEFQKYYYYDKKLFLEACQKLRIKSSNDYRNMYNKDKKLPSFDYISDGFYYDLDPKFNLQLLLNTDIDDDDI